MFYYVAEPCVILVGFKDVLNNKPLILPLLKHEAQIFRMQMPTSYAFDVSWSQSLLSGHPGV